MMIKPSIEQLTKGEINRYELVIATAKCARIVTDEYVEQREKGHSGSVHTHLCRIGGMR